MVFMAVAIMVVFILAFSLTIGTLAWVYSAEVLTEKGKGEEDLGFGEGKWRLGVV